MALHLNLYHEIHKQAERERRDPVKLAGLAALVVVILMTMWYFYRSTSVNRARLQSSAVNSEWGRLEPELKKLEAGKEKVLAQQKANRAVIERLQNRFYWAPVLERLAGCTGANVQLVSVIGDVTEQGADKSIILFVKGIAAGEQPRTAAEEFRKTLQKKFAEVYRDSTALFDANSLEDEAETVNLNGATLATATFRIRVKFTAPAPGASPSPSPSSSPKATR